MGSWLWAVSILILAVHSSVSEASSTADLFGAWCEQYGKTYSSEEEKASRLKVFEENHAFVTQHNSMANASYTLALNAFADLTHHEFKASRLGFSPGRAQSIRSVGTPVQELHVPPAVDWRKSGAVTGVKDQGNCGGCWSFSTTGAIEGINKIVTGSLVSLSEQELVDCDRSYNSGCQGGLMDYAYQFVIKNQGIDSEADYPYVGMDKPCNKEKLKKHIVTIDGYTDIPPNDEKQLLQVVAKQPVSVGICGSEKTFQLYSKGVYTGPCSSTLDHAVLIVGYGTEDGVDFWIVKNSWGEHWGMHGYIHMLRNNGTAEGICGINMLASYPAKTSPNPPPPPTPGPTKCDFFSSCSEGETCCCSWRFIGVCLSWNCCTAKSAVCCDNNNYCCPASHPICDTKRNRCLKPAGNGTGVEVLKRRGSSVKFGGWSSINDAWNL